MEEDTVNTAELLVDKYADTLFRIAIQNTGVTQEAEDIVQDVFLAMAQKSPFRERGTREALADQSDRQQVPRLFEGVEKEKSATRREYRRYILPSRLVRFAAIAKVAASRQDDRLSVLFRGLQRKRDRNNGRENSQRRSDPPDEGERGVERIVRGGVTMDENKYREEMSKVQMSEQKKSGDQAQYLLFEPQRKSRRARSAQKNVSRQEGGDCRHAFCFCSRCDRRRTAVAKSL